MRSTPWRARTSRPCAAPPRSKSRPSRRSTSIGLKMGDHVQTGVAGTWSVDEYEKDLIKKHEKTRSDKEDDRTQHMCALRAQTGKVFLTYKASVKVDAIAARVARGEPLFDFTAADGVAHTVWRAGLRIGTRWSLRSLRFPSSTSPTATIAPLQPGAPAARSQPAIRRTPRAPTPAAPRTFSQSPSQTTRFRFCRTTDWSRTSAATPPRAC